MYRRSGGTGVRLGASQGGGSKLFYYGVDAKRNDVGVILKEAYTKSVLEIRRVSDRVKVKVKVRFY